MGLRRRAAPADSLFLTVQCAELMKTLRMGWKSPSQPGCSRPLGPRREGRFAGCGYRCRKDLRTSEFTELVQTEQASVPQPAPRPATSGVPTEPGGSPCRPGACLRPYMARHSTQLWNVLGNSVTQSVLFLGSRGSAASLLGPPALCTGAPTDALLPGAVGPWGNEATAKAGGCGRGTPKLTLLMAYVGLWGGSRDSDSTGRSSGVTRPGTTVPCNASQRSQG